MAAVTVVPPAKCDGCVTDKCPSFRRKRVLAGRRYRNLYEWLTPMWWYCSEWRRTSRQYIVWEEPYER